MRVNVYAEEMTDNVELIEKTTPDGTFIGVRFWLALPVTIGRHPPTEPVIAHPFGSPEYIAAAAEARQMTHRSIEGSPEVFPPVSGRPAQVSGPFLHRPGDDDSAAVTFWGKRQLRRNLEKALALLDAHDKARGR